MSTPIIRMIEPIETTRGTDKAISKVAVFSGLGNRIGDSVASKSPSILKLANISTEYDMQIKKISILSGIFL